MKKTESKEKKMQINKKFVGIIAIILSVEYSTKFKFHQILFVCACFSVACGNLHWASIRHLNKAIKLIPTL